MRTLNGALSDGVGAAEMARPAPGARPVRVDRGSAEPAGRTAWRCACEICRTSMESAPAYFTRSFGEPDHFAATREGIADSLGFCQRHGADLMGSASLQAGMAQVFQGVIPRVLPLLSEQRFADDKFQHVYFSAPDACPACTCERRAVGRHAARLGRQHAAMAESRAVDGGAMPLCHEHFQTLARGLNPELRMPLLARHAQWLDCAARAVEDLLAAGVSRETVPGELPALEHALGIAGGQLDVVPAPPAALVEALWDCPGIEQAIGWANACPVCVEIERARQHWLATVPLAAKYHLDDRLFFPTCPEHVATLARLGDTPLTAVVAAHALHVATEHVLRQLRVLVRAAETESERAAARIAHWGRRPRRRKPELPRPPALRIARCAACERLAIAEIHATCRLLQLLRSHPYRHAFEDGYGLCMKHHAQAYVLAPKGIVRSLLASDQIRRLSGLLRWLEDEMSGVAQSEAGATPRSEYRLALRRFCGFG